MSVVHQALLSVEFFRQEYWGGLSFPTPRDLPDPGIESRSPAFQVNALLTELLGKPQYFVIMNKKEYEGEYLSMESLHCTPETDMTL